jgi:hypothetical protein
MLKLVFAPSDAAFAERVQHDVRSKRPLDVIGAENIALAKGDVLLVVISADGAVDKNVEAAYIAALDKGLHIIPILSAPAKLPRMIDHLMPLDMTEGYVNGLIESELQQLESGVAPMPVKVLTPSMRKSNRTAGFIVAIAAVVMFFAGLYAVGVMGIQAPQDEYEDVQREAMGTRDALMAPELQRYALMLPRSTEDALQYAATLQRVPTLYRPFMAQTATAVVTPDAADAVIDASVPSVITLTPVPTGSSAGG